MIKKITNMQEAKKVAREGFIASMAVSIITTIGIIISMTGVDFLGLDLFAFLDVAIFLIIGFGIYKISRIAAVLGLCLYLFEQISMILVSGRFSWMMIIFTLAFCNSIRGTFAYHKFKKLTNDDVAA